MHNTKPRKLNGFEYWIAGEVGHWNIYFYNTKTASITILGEFTTIIKANIEAMRIIVLLSVIRSDLCQ
jgi:hypothetical protein